MADYNRNLCLVENKTHTAMISLCNGLICCRLSLISTLGQVVSYSFKWVEFKVGGKLGIMISKYNAA